MKPNMKPLENIGDLMDYLEKREIKVGKKVDFWCKKHETPSMHTTIKLCAAMGAKKELQTIMLRIIGYYYKDMPAVLNATERNEPI